MRLCHFSEDPSIGTFEPRPVREPSVRAPGRDWLNGPLVWAIDAWHEPMYYFPRDCPRILLWPTPTTTSADRERWWGQGERRILAHIEEAWLPRLRTARLFRYSFAADGFERLDDAGMWVSRTRATPLSVEPLGDLVAALEATDVELRVLPDLTPLKGVWETSLHASGIRLRNAVGWTT